MSVIHCCPPFIDVEASDLPGIAWALFIVRSIDTLVTFVDKDRPPSYSREEYGVQISGYH
jgi:hypothetical protein